MKQSMKIENFIGYKFFKEIDQDTIECIRLFSVDKSDNTVLVYTNKEETFVKRITVDELSEYTPLEPDGYITFNTITVLDEEGNTNPDVIITASKILNLKIGDTVPFAVCRQSITDIFYNLICQDETKMMTGLSINQDNCPTNFDFRTMLACNRIDYSYYFNIYRNDTIEHILNIIDSKPKKKLNEVLKILYLKHIKAKYGNITNIMSMSGKSDQGWCKSLKTLLNENNFQADVDEMLGITSLDFKLSDHFVEKPLPGKDNITYHSANDDLRLWLSSIYKVNINDCTFLEYDNDINLAEFKNSKYLLLRDNTDQLYLVVYTAIGEFHESDLIAKDQEQDFSTKFRINFYNKYHKNNIVDKN